MNANEVFFQNPVITEKRRNDISFQFYHSPSAEMVLEQDRFIKPDGEKILGAACLPDIFPALFTDKNLIETLPSTNLHVYPHFQLGKKGLISLVKTESPQQEPYYFITHLSRFPIDHPSSGYLEQEYQDLVYLHERAEKILPQKLKNQYGVVKPLGCGLSDKINETKYPLMIVEYKPMGELTLDSVVIEDFYTPFFRYALLYDQQMEDVSKKELTKALDHGIDYFKTRTRDFLVFWSLIYLLADQRLPKNWLINAGDTLVDINDKDWRFTLSSIQDGFT